MGKGRVRWPYSEFHRAQTSIDKTMFFTRFGHLVGPRLTPMLGIRRLGRCSNF